MSISYYIEFINNHDIHKIKLSTYSLQEDSRDQDIRLEFLIISSSHKESTVLDR